MTSQQRAFKDGYVAHGFDEPRSTNPHIPGTPESREWDRGWMKSAGERLDEMAE